MRNLRILTDNITSHKLLGTATQQKCSKSETKTAGNLFYLSQTFCIVGYLQRYWNHNFELKEQNAGLSAMSMVFEGIEKLAILHLGWNGKAVKLQSNRSQSGRRPCWRYWRITPEGNARKESLAAGSCLNIRTAESKMLFLLLLSSRNVIIVITGAEASCLKHFLHTKETSSSGVRESFFLIFFSFFSTMSSSFDCEIIFRSNFLLSSSPAVFRFANWYGF